MEDIGHVYVEWRHSVEGQSRLERWVKYGIIREEQMSGENDCGWWRKMVMLLTALYFIFRT